VPIPQIQPSTWSWQVRQAGGQFDLQLHPQVCSRRRRRPHLLDLAAGQRAQRRLVGAGLGGPEPDRPVEDVVGHRPGGRPPVPHHRCLAQLQQFNQPPAAPRLSAPRQLLGGLVQYERDLHHLDVDPSVQQLSECVRGPQDRFGPADLAAPLGDGPQPADDGVSTHQTSLPDPPRPPFTDGPPARPSAITATFLYNGTRSLFEQAGFTCSRPKGVNHCVMTTTVAPVTY
jgi:hypothetical protein